MRVTQVGLDGADGWPGSWDWREECRRFKEQQRAPEPSKVLAYIRRCHRMVVPLYGAMCAYWQAHAPPETSPSLATWEQVSRTDAVCDFSDGSLSQTENDVSRISDRVRVDRFGMDPNQAWGLEMAFRGGVDDPGRAVQLATESIGAPSILSCVLERSQERREKVYRLIECGEFAQARALATCGEMSAQLGCPEMGGGCGFEENYVPISCDSRLCPECMRRRIGQLVERYERAVADFRTPVFGTFTVENVTVETAGDLVRGVEAVQGAFGRLRQRTIPPEGSTERVGSDGNVSRKRWVWKTDGGEPATDYWRTDLIRAGYRDRADRLEREYVDEGRNIPFKELVDAGIYAIDIKQKGPAEFNIHLHAIMDAAYIPQPALSSVWEDLVPGSPVVDIRRIYDRDGGTVRGALVETVAYACKAPEFESVGDEVNYLKALKGKRMVQPFGELHGNVDDLPPSLCCAECDKMPAWWEYLGVVNERVDNMGSVHDGESTGCDPPASVA